MARLETCHPTRCVCFHVLSVYCHFGKVPMALLLASPTGNAYASCIAIYAVRPSSDEYLKFLNGTTRNQEGQKGHLGAIFISLDFVAPRVENEHHILIDDNP